jgi:hypothetical protein
MIATATISQSSFDFIADDTLFRQCLPVLLFDCDRCSLHHHRLRAWASLISLPLTQLVRLHSDPLALRAPPFSLLVVDVPFEFFHGDFTAFAGHDTLFVSMIALP